MDASITTPLRGLFKAMRPHQWVKNLFVLAPLVFAKAFFDPESTARSALAFLLFSFAASSVYLLNDLADLESDRAHPIKRNRPIASGVVPIPTAKTFTLLLVATALGLGWPLGWRFVACIAAYLTINLAYSLKVKHIAYLDVLSIALGFELRVLAGSFAIPVPPSEYLLAVTFLLALFLGLGKRLHELQQAHAAHKSRQVLQQYSESTLTVLLYITGLCTVGLYVVYTLDPQTSLYFGTPHLIWTAPMPLFGVLRFLHLVRTRHHAESPTEDMLRDVPFLLNLGVWFMAVVTVITVGA